MYVKKNNRPAAPAAPPMKYGVSGQNGTPPVRDEGRALPKHLQSSLTKSGNKYPWGGETRKPPLLEPITDKLPRLVERPAPDAPKPSASIAAYLGGIDPSTVPNYCAAEVPMLMRAAIGKRAIERNAFDPNRDYSKHGPPVAKVQQSPVPAQIKQTHGPWSPSYTDVLMNRYYDPGHGVYAGSSGISSNAVHLASTKSNRGTRKTASYADITSNGVKHAAPVKDFFPPLETESKLSKYKPMPLIEKKKVEERLPVKAALGETVPPPSSKTKREGTTYSWGQNIPIDPELVAIKKRKLEEVERLKSERQKQIEEKAAMEKPEMERIEHEQRMRELEMELVRRRELKEIERERKREKQRERYAKRLKQIEIEQKLEMEKAEKERIEHEARMHELEMERVRRQELKEIERKRKREKRTERQDRDSRRAQIEKIKVRDDEEKTMLEWHKTKRIRTEKEETKSMEDVSPKHRSSKRRQELAWTQKCSVEMQMENEAKISPKVQRSQAPESHHRQSVMVARRNTGEWDQKFHFDDSIAVQTTQKCDDRAMNLENDSAYQSDDEIDEVERWVYEAKAHELHVELELQSLRSDRKKKEEKDIGTNDGTYQKTVMNKKEAEQQSVRDWDWSDYKPDPSRRTKINVLTEYGEMTYDELDKQTEVYKASPRRKKWSRQGREENSMHQVMETDTTSIKGPIPTKYSNDGQGLQNKELVYDFDEYGISIQSSKTKKKMRKSTIEENKAVDDYTKASKMSLIKRAKPAEVRTVAEQEAITQKELGCHDAQNKNVQAEQKSKDQCNRDEDETEARRITVRQNAEANEGKSSEPMFKNIFGTRPPLNMELGAIEEEEEEEEELDSGSTVLEEELTEVMDEETGFSDDFEAFMNRNGMVIHSVIYPEPGEDFVDFLKRKERIQLEREQQQNLAQTKVRSAKSSVLTGIQKPAVSEPGTLDLIVYGKSISIIEDHFDDVDFQNLDDDEYIECMDEGEPQFSTFEMDQEVETTGGSDLPETDQNGLSFFPEIPDFETFMEKNNMIIDDIVYPEFGEDPEDFKKRKEMTILQNRRIKEEQNRKKYGTRCNSPEENLDCRRNLVELFPNRPSTSLNVEDSLHGISSLSNENPDNFLEKTDISGRMLKKHHDDMEADAMTEMKHPEEDTAADRLQAKYEWWKMKQDVGPRYNSQISDKMDL